ncbi:outer membrane lipoprotein Omp10 [Rhizobium calliandrae]|uniref:Outer membrane lipoprotein Omp10 n=1 Tax=Rhizobium calliandrae TaxID=1312182 RepID=A0ABT7KA83_9HYPH|nr:outer membrane lipoprotein Omp10 [Rhizobium calliandrae]MDL2405534.1 outer membrane lipoprotein Omp10 [Rhizobium calliandrae]
MKIRTSLALIAAAAALSACVDFGGSRAPPATRASVQPQGVEGNWSDANGLISTFQAGTFTTHTTDSNSVLASGTYTNVSPGLIEINMTSLVRKTQSKINCALISPYQLNCTSDAGKQFSLNRR